MINAGYENVWFTINGSLKMLFFDFCLFHFSKFQITIVKNYLEKLSSFIMAFESSNKVLLHGKCF